MRVRPLIVSARAINKAIPFLHGSLSKEKDMKETRILVFVSAPQFVTSNLMAQNVMENFSRHIGS